MTDDAQKKFRTWFFSICAAIIVGIVIYSTFLYKRKPVADPNDSLVEYLKADSRHKDSLIAVLQTEIKGILRSDSIREHRDSSTLAAQNRLSKSIQNIQSQYEKIPSYSNLSHDSLRRLHTEKFGN